LNTGVGTTAGAYVNSLCLTERRLRRCHQDEHQQGEEGDRHLTVAAMKVALRVHGSSGCALNSTQIDYERPQYTRRVIDASMGNWYQCFQTREVRAKLVAITGSTQETRMLPDLGHSGVPVGDNDRYAPKIPPKVVRVNLRSGYDSTATGRRMNSEQLDQP
jgi:hypothetical protein